MVIAPALVDGLLLTVSGAGLPLVPSGAPELAGCSLAGGLAGLD